MKFFKLVLVFLISASHLKASEPSNVEHSPEETIKHHAEEIVGLLGSILDLNKLSLSVQEHRTWLQEVDETEWSRLKNGERRDQNPKILRTFPAVFRKGIDPNEGVPCFLNHTIESAPWGKVAGRDFTATRSNSAYWQKMVAGTYNDAVVAGSYVGAVGGCLLGGAVTLSPLSPGGAMCGTTAGSAAGAIAGGLGATAVVTARGAVEGLGVGVDKLMHRSKKGCFFCLHPKEDHFCHEVPFYMSPSLAGENIVAKYYAGFTSARELSATLELQLDEINEKIPEIRNNMIDPLLDQIQIEAFFISEDEGEQFDAVDGILSTIEKPQYLSLLEFEGMIEEIRTHIKNQLDIEG